MPLLTLIIRFIVFTVIGYFVGLFITGVMFKVNQYRLERKHARMIKKQKTHHALSY